MSTRSSSGGLPPHFASHATISSSRPRLPGGLVNSAWRAATAAAAVLSPSGRSRHAARSSASDRNGPDGSAPLMGDAVFMGELVRSTLSEAPYLARYLASSWPTIL